MTVTGEIKSRIDSVWNDFWSGGISNPLEVIEQLTYLLFIKGLDEAQTREEAKANRLGTPLPADVPFPDGDFTPEGTDRSIPYREMRWSHLTHLGAPQRLFDIVNDFVFPFLRERAGDTSHAVHMDGATGGLGTHPRSRSHGTRRLSRVTRAVPVRIGAIAY